MTSAEIAIICPDISIIYTHKIITEYMTRICRATDVVTEDGSLLQLSEFLIGENLEMATFLETHDAKSLNIS